MAGTQEGIMTSKAAHGKVGLKEQTARLFLLTEVVGTAATRWFLFLPVTFLLM
jgi:hypothetical protein